MAIVGSIKALSINALPFSVTGDSDPSRKPSREATSTATSGAALISIEKMTGDIESITIDVSNLADYESLKPIMGNATLVPASLTMADGQVLRSEACMIHMNDAALKSGTVDISLLPSNDWQTA